MSETEIDEEDEDEYEWRQLPFKDTTEHATADFSETGWNQQYHQYVRIENPETGSNANVEFTVEEPDEFDNQMGFTVLEGIVEPGETEGIAEEDGSIERNRAVAAGETDYFTVIYTLDNAPTDNEYDVIWDFYEGEHTTETEDIVNAVDNAEEGDVIFVEEGEYEVDETISIEEDGIQLLADGEVTISPADGADLDSSTTLVIEDSSDVRVSGFDFEDFLPNDGANAISIRESENVVIEENTFSATLDDDDSEDDWSSTAIIVSGDGTWYDPSSDITIKGNTIDIQGPSTIGFAGYGTSEISVYDNTFEEGPEDYVYAPELDLEDILETNEFPDDAEIDGDYIVPG